MNQIIIQIPLIVLVVVLVVVAIIFAWLIYLINKKKLNQTAEVEIKLKPFSEPRPLQEPIPPIRIAAPPAIPIRDPNIKPIRYAYDQRFFEWFYAVSDGKILKTYKNVGDSVEKGDRIMKVFTGNTEMDIRASASGKIREIVDECGMIFQRSDLLYVIVIK